MQSQSDKHWNRFQGNEGETSERRGGANMGFSERLNAILIWTKVMIMVMIIIIDVL